MPSNVNIDGSELERFEGRSRTLLRSFRNRSALLLLAAARLESADKFEVTVFELARGILSREWLEDVRESERSLGFVGRSLLRGAIEDGGKGSLFVLERACARITCQ